MNKIIGFMLLLFVQTAGAQILSASYDVSFGIFQAMGNADARFEIKNDQTYTIRIEARTTGIAKLLSNNRVEIYESRGTVKNGRLIPDTYTKIRQTNEKKNIKIYTFDHTNRIVWKETAEIKDTNVHKEEKEKNDYYAQEDILSLFFNLKLYSQAKENALYYAIGANKKEGRIDVVFPKNDALREMKNALGTTGGDFLKVILNERIFSSANGELLINLGNDGLCDKAILEDVLFFGDIVGKRVR